MLLKIKLLSLFVIFFLSSTSWANELNIVVSVKPIHSIVSGLTKGAVKPYLLVDGQQSLYEFKPSQQDLKQLNNASLVIWVGPELETNLVSNINNLAKTTKVVELLSSANLKILPSRKNPEKLDPFFWMDDRNIMILVDELTRLLVNIDPERAHIYTKNRRELLIPLRKIDKEYEYGYRGLKAGLGVLYYDTLQYFEQAYALKTLGRVTGTMNDNITASDLLVVRTKIANKEASCLFIDKSMPSDNINLLTSGHDINIGELDILGKNFTSGEDLYLQIMQYNTDVIKKCLNANMSDAAKARILADEKNQASYSGVGQGRFILKDHNNNLFTEKDMQGKYSLVFFGYTYCPDVCPTNMFILAQAFKKMGDSANNIVPYFISVDPERDSAKVLRDYVAFFDDRIIGLTGSKVMIKRVAEQYKAKYEKSNIDDKDSSLYTMDHTSSLYLLAPDGSFVAKFAHGIAPDVLANELTAIMGSSH